MGRVTYLHHYFPALYFTVLMFAFLMDHYTRHSSKSVQYAVFIPIYSVVILTFIHFAPISFGMEGPISNYESLVWRKTWDIVVEKKN